MKIKVEQEKQEFKPFVLSLEIESEDELKELYNRFNPTEGVIKEILGLDYKECSSNNCYEIFKILDDKLSDEQ